MNAGTIESVFQEFACPSLNINVNAWLVLGSKASQSDVNIMKTKRRESEGIFWRTTNDLTRVQSGEFSGWNEWLHTRRPPYKNPLSSSGFILWSHCMVSDYTSEMKTALALLKIAEKRWVDVRHQLFLAKRDKREVQTPWQSLIQLHQSAQGLHHVVSRFWIFCRMSSPVRLRVKASRSAPAASKWGLYASQSHCTSASQSYSPCQFWVNCSSTSR